MESSLAKNLFDWMLVRALIISMGVVIIGALILWMSWKAKVALGIGLIPAITGQLDDPPRSEGVSVPLSGPVATLSAPNTVTPKNTTSPVIWILK
jgi:hypothetical protein